MSHPRRHGAQHRPAGDYDHEVIAPEGVKVAIEAANVFEVLGGGHPNLSLTWEQFRALPKAVNCDYPNKPVPLGLVWRTQTKEELYVGHALSVNRDGAVTDVEWFSVTISDV